MKRIRTVLLIFFVLLLLIFTGIQTSFLPYKIDGDVRVNNYACMIFKDGNKNYFIGKIFVRFKNGTTTQQVDKSIKNSNTLIDQRLTLAKDHVVIHVPYGLEQIYAYIFSKNRSVESVKLSGCNNNGIQF